MNTTSTSSASSSAPLPAETAIEHAVHVVADKGFAQYLVDSEVADELAVYLRDEARIPPALTKAVLKAILPLALKRARPAASWVGKAGGRVIAARLKRLPGVPTVLTALTQALERFDADAAAKRRFDDLLTERRAGRCTPESGDTGADDTAGLSRDLKADLEILASVDTLRDEFADLADAVDALARQLTPQPPLRLRRLPLSERTRFVYGARSTRLVGRDDEMAALEAFLDAPGLLRWWVVTGPGGMGKSRLALELALRYGTAARVGFLRWPWTVAWDAWQPDRPTVIVVDYAEQLADAVRDALARLAERDDLAFSVRVLLLARHAGQEHRRAPTAADAVLEPRSTWVDRLMSTGSTRALLEHALYKPPLELRPLDDAALTSVMTAFLTEAPASAVTPEAVRALVRLDPQRRPLFAAFAGDAINRGADIRQWNRGELLENIRREEQSFWSRAGVTEAERELLMLATLTGGIGVDALRPPAGEVCGVDVGAVDPERYRAMTGVAADQQFTPLEPDILGEYYVLERLTPRSPDDWRAWEALRRAGDLVVKGTGGFLERAAADFPDHPTVARWLARPPATIATSRQVAGVLAMLGNGYVRAEDLPGLRAAHAAVVALDEEAPHPGAARDVRAVLAGNLSLTAGLADHVEEAARAYEDVARCSDADLENAGLRRWRALVATDLVIDFSQASDVDALRRLLDEYAVLRAGYPSDPALRDTWSRTAYQYLHALGDRRAFKTAASVMRELRRLAAAYPSEVLVRQRAARAARNLQVDYVGMTEPPFLGADLVGAAAAYEDVRTLVRRHPTDPEIRQQFLWAAHLMYNLYRHRRDQLHAAAVAAEVKRLERTG